MQVFAQSCQVTFKGFQRVLDLEFQERFLQPNPYQPVMMGRQAHFIATVTTQKIIYFVTRSRIVPDGFNMGDQSRFQALIAIVVNAALIEIDVVLINKIVQAPYRIVLASDSEQLYFIMCKPALDQLLVKLKQVV
jgi:hypothetical protein